MTVEETKLRLPSRLRIVDGVFHSLEEAILSGDLPPGTRLVETSIAKQLEVSRTTVREAFLMLERHGLVVSRPRRGTFVTRISREDALDLGYTRSLLEAFAVTVGYDRIDDDVVDELERLLEEMGLCSLPEGFPRLVAIDLEFHARLVASAQMPRLFELWSSLNGQIGALYIRGVEELHLRIDDIVMIHRQLLDVIRSGSPVDAQRAIIQHYVRSDGSTTRRGVATQDVLRAVGMRFLSDPTGSTTGPVET